MLLRMLGAGPADALGTLMERTNNRLLSGLDGLRSFSMLWIILAHTTLLVCLLGTDDQDVHSTGFGMTHPSMTHPSMTHPSTTHPRPVHP